MITLQDTIIATSDIASGATKIKHNGSEFSIEFIERTINIPRSAINLQIGLSGAEIWYNNPNIVTDVNDKFYINYSATDYVLVISQGLYGVAELNNELKRKLDEESLATDLITIVGDDATGKIILEITDAMSIDFSVARTDTLRDMLGFDPQIITTIGAQYVYSDKVGKFNTLNHYLLHSSIVDYGIPISGKYNNVIGKVQIVVDDIGEQIKYEPSNIIYTNADNMRGRSIRELKVWLTDENNNYVNTNNEAFSVTMAYKYSLTLAEYEKYFGN